MRLAAYATKYENLQIDRIDGILQLRLHTEGATIKWGHRAHIDLGKAFADIASDPENRVLIITGTGPAFCAERLGDPSGAMVTPEAWAQVTKRARQFLHNYLEIEMPIIAAVNGPAHYHPEIPLLADIVLAAETATFRNAHIAELGLVPGDGNHVVWPLLLGPNRGRYFLLTGQTLSAREAKDLGIVAEVLDVDKLLPRAWEHAERLTELPTMTTRLSRLALMAGIKRAINEDLHNGLLLAGYSLMGAGDPTQGAPSA
jgi:enoyl-CoA hydratase/carnithine racemase